MHKLCSVFRDCFICALIIVGLFLSYGGTSYAKENYVDTQDALYTYEEMVVDIGKLAKAYPEHFTYEIIGQSSDGRNLFALTVGNIAADKSILVESGTHAREYINCMLTMHQVETYLQNWDSVYLDGVTYGEILTECNLLYIPMTNPDGVTISQYGIDAIQNSELRALLYSIAGSSSVTRWKANARGVDLNRNYDCYFNGVMEKSAPSSQDFNGYAPETEPEILAVESFVRSKTGIIGAISFHSAESAVFYNVGDAALPEVLARSYDMARVAISMNGYALYMDERGYSKPRGLFYHWMLIQEKIPTILIETCKGTSPQKYSEWNKLRSGNLLIPMQMCYTFGCAGDTVKASTNMTCSVWSSPNTKKEENRLKQVGLGYMVEIYPRIITGVDGKQYYRTKKGNYILSKCLNIIA